MSPRLILTRLMLIVFSVAVVVLGIWQLTERVGADEATNQDMEVTHFVELAGQRLRVTLADTPSEQAAGLSNRPSLDADEGMLFRFDKPSILSFWMKEMRFPIDIIWIRDRVVVDVTKEAEIPTSGRPLRIYRPAEAADTVLEVRAGFSDEFGVQPGLSLQYFCAGEGIDATLSPC